MSLFTAQLYPGRALGFLVLGASLHDILTRLKAEPQRFPKLDVIYSPTNPVRDPVTLNLPPNGIRLRFDGPEQRLRLIEILDFTKNHIIFKEQNKDRDLVKPGAAGSGEQAGPTFRHIYTRFLGPTYDGEFVPDAEGRQGQGKYVLSYPGVAFTFPMAASAYSPDKDVVSLLSAQNPPVVALSMAVFSGDSWAQAREALWTEVLPSIKTFAPLAKGKDVSPDEISLVKIHGGGRLQLFRRWTTSSFWITLGETTPQELVIELGPPDAIYRKNDQRMYIHKIRTASSSRTRPNGADLRRQDDFTDTDQSSGHTASEGDSDDDEAVEDDMAGANVSGECFYNYFYLGFDILVSTPVAPSRPPPSSSLLSGVSQDGGEDAASSTSASASASASASTCVPDRFIKVYSPDRLVATKMILHGNVPGSYPFNRHRRCRWEISYLRGSADAAPPEPESSAEEEDVNSEAPFPRMEEHLREEWKSIYASEEEAKKQQRGMVLNRGWGDSPGSSIELLGGWEGHRGGSSVGPGRGVKSGEDSTTTLYGFPGLVFEVLKNGFASALTVF